MLQIICLKKTKCTLKELQYSSICNLCKVLFYEQVDTNKKNICNFCSQKQTQITNNQTFIFNLKSLLYKIINLKNNNLSFFDFEMIEKSLLKQSEKSNLFYYSSQNLQWYISGDSDSFPIVFNVMFQIYNKLNKILFPDKNNDHKILMNKFQEKFTNFIRTERVSCDCKVFNPVLNEPEILDTNIYLHLNRQIIFEKLNQSFDFFDDLQ